MNAENLTTHSKPSSRIFGRVFSTDGAMLQGVRVSCQGKETRTLADGTFVFKDLPPGSYKVVVNLEGFESESKDISIQAGENVIQDFHLAKTRGTAKICGHVYDAESKKIVSQGGTVILIMPVANRYKHIDRNGYYEFENLLAGKYTLVTSLQGFEDNKIVQSVVDGEIRILDFFCKPMRTEEPLWG